VKKKGKKKEKDNTPEAETDLDEIEEIEEEFSSDLDELA
jgi:hypothetical protein